MAVGKNITWKKGKEKVYNPYNIEAVGGKYQVGKRERGRKFPIIISYL